MPRTKLRLDSTRAHLRLALLAALQLLLRLFLDISPAARAPTASAAVQVCKHDRPNVKVYWILHENGLCELVNPLSPRVRVRPVSVDGINVPYTST